MPNKADFDRDPRAYALALIEEGVSLETLVTAALKYLSTDDVREMLDMNELSPRFLDEDEDEDEDAADDDEDEDV